MANNNKGIKSLWGYPLIDSKARHAIDDVRSNIENNYQKKNDDTLTTTNKTIVGSINEVAAQYKDIAKLNITTANKSKENKLLFENLHVLRGSLGIGKETNKIYYWKNYQRATLNPLLIKLEEGKTYKIELNSSDYFFGPTGWKLNSDKTSNNFTVTTDIDSNFDASRIMDCGWKQLSYNISMENCNYLGLAFKQTNGADFNGKDLKNISSLLKIYEVSANDKLTLLDKSNNNLIEFISDEQIENEKYKLLDFMSNINIDYNYDSTTNANYTVIRIYKNKIDGSLQYPFVYCPNGNGAGIDSTLDMVTKDKEKKLNWYLAINAGIFNVTTKKPDGIVIENGVSIQNTPATTYAGCKPLTINTDGDLSYAEADVTTDTLISNCIVSAVCGFMPIVLDYKAVNSSEWNDVSHYTQNAQRQIIGQFGNGDYAIITCEGRNYQNSDGWTIEEAQNICIKHGLKFAYNLDGGGSTEIVLGLKQFNTIYENKTGRVVPTFIVFNGANVFDK